MYSTFKFIGKSMVGRNAILVVGNCRLSPSIWTRQPVTLNWEDRQLLWAVEFNSGSIARFTVSQQRARLVVQ
jgi:hypothetical protein